MSFVKSYLSRNNELIISLVVCGQIFLRGEFKNCFVLNNKHTRICIYYNTRIYTLFGRIQNGMKGFANVEG